MTNFKSDAALRSGDDVGMALSDANFDAITKRIYRDTGIVISAAKRSMLISRLARRLRHLALPDFTAYAELLDSADGEDERIALVSAITTNVTGFFRESHHFDALAELTQSLIEKARTGGRVRLWSAGCSTGQEAYSIAATIINRAPDIAQNDLRILATDIDPVVIDQAHSGVYDTRLLGDNPPAVLKRFVQAGPNSGQSVMSETLRALIRFEVLNLLEPWPFQGQFDVIFCRNVVIYFDADTRRELWTRFASRIPPGGVLFIGHSERMDPQLDPLFELSGVTQYRRTKQVVTGRHAPALPPKPAEKIIQCP